MSSTNKTTYYDLPQFVDNDIFNPLVDDNDAYSKIDTALHNIANAEADDASEIVGIKSRLDSAEDDIDALETQNGNNVLTTTAQTLSGAVNELDGDVSALDGRLDIVEDDINNVSTGLKAKVVDLGNRMTTAEGDIDALEAQNGNETLITTAQTLSGAINEIDADIEKISIGINVKSFGAVGDGVTDDGDAIRSAIAYCNEHGANLYFPKATYLYNFTETVNVKCNIDFGGSTIILGDPESGISAFSMGGDNEKYTLTETALGEFTVNDSRLFNKSMTVYTPLSVGRRYGNGDEYFYHQFFITDNNGRIANGPFWPVRRNGTYIFDNVRDINEVGYTIKNAKVVSTSDNVGYGVGFLYVRRNNVIVENLHFEYPAIANVQWNAPILSAQGVTHVKFNNITAVNPYGTGGSGYVIEFDNCFECEVDNFIGTDKAGGSWGSIGTSYCDNMLYTNCTTQRIDAHVQGTYTAKNCNLYWANFSGGYGNVIFDNCMFNYWTPYEDTGSIIDFRNDHMFLLTGEIVVKNCRFFYPDNKEPKAVVGIIMDRESVVDLTTFKHDGLKITIDNCDMSWKMLIPLKLFFKAGYGSMVSAIVKNSKLNTQALCSTIPNEVSIKMKSLLYYNCDNSRRNYTVYFGLGDRFAYVEVNKCVFVGGDGFVETSSVSAPRNEVLSIINCVLPKLKTVTSNVVRVLDNLVTSDTALDIGGSPQIVKRGNVITDSTQTNISTWNS